jgi:ribosomal protein L7/L12
MAQGRTIAAGVSFGIGLFCGLIALLGVTQPNPTPEQQFGSIGVGLLGGVPSVALGTWLLVQNRDRRTQQERDRIQGIFYKLLKESNGQINVLRFSMEAGITGTEAKAFLDERAREFNAAFNVTEEGKIFYYFDGDFNALAAAQTYDVVLESFPGRNRVSVLNILHYQNNLSRPLAKALLKQGRSHPVTIARGITERQANALRQQLEACGATVLVIPKG